LNINGLSLTEGTLQDLLQLRLLVYLLFLFPYLILHRFYLFVSSLYIVCILFPELRQPFVVLAMRLILEDFCDFCFQLIKFGMAIFQTVNTFGSSILEIIQFSIQILILLLQYLHRLFGFR
jgi:hypothetical protein